MTDIEQEARAEAEKRWPRPGGASHPATAQIMASGRQSGKTAAMIDALLDRANERGIRVEIVEPAPTAYASPKIADHLDRLARDVAYTEGHASVMRAAADVIRQAASPATRETVTEEMVERAARRMARDQFGSVSSHDAYRTPESDDRERDASGYGAWDSGRIAEAVKDGLRRDARAALEAALGGEKGGE